MRQGHSLQTTHAGLGWCTAHFLAAVPCGPHALLLVHHDAPAHHHRHAIRCQTRLFSRLLVLRSSCCGLASWMSHPGSLGSWHENANKQTHTGFPYLSREAQGSITRFLCFDTTQFKEYKSFFFYFIQYNDLTKCLFSFRNAPNRGPSVKIYDGCSPAVQFFSLDGWASDYILIFIGSPFPPKSTVHRKNQSFLKKDWDSTNESTKLNVFGFPRTHSSLKCIQFFWPLFDRNLKQYHFLSTSPCILSRTYCEIIIFCSSSRMPTLCMNVIREHNSR